MGCFPLHNKSAKPFSPRAITNHNVYPSGSLSPWYASRTGVCIYASFSKNHVNSNIRFNSFSQELKINDVVQKPGGIPATDTDLNRVSAYKPRATDPRNAATPLSTPEGTVSRIDPHTQVSQTIKWEARFIQHLSDITRRMDVSG